MLEELIRWVRALNPEDLRLVYIFVLELRRGR